MYVSIAVNFYIAYMLFYWVEYDKNRRVYLACQETQKNISNPISITQIRSPFLLASSTDTMSVRINQHSSNLHLCKAESSKQLSCENSKTTVNAIQRLTVQNKLQVIKTELLQNKVFTINHEIKPAFGNSKGTSQPCKNG